MVRVKGPTLQDLATLGDRFTDVVVNAARATLRSASREVSSHTTADDIGKIPTWWAQHVDGVLMPELAASYWHGVNVVHGGLAHAAHALTAAVTADQTVGIELFPDDNPGPVTPGNLPSTAGMIPRVPNVVAEATLGQQRNHLVGIGDELWENARTELIAGVNAGEGVDKLRDRVLASLDVSAPRAGVIARTEVNGAVSAGSLAEMREIGLPAKKEWIATAGKRTRPSHAAVDGTQVDLQDKFLVGGHHLDRPHDPGAPAGEVINCRCTLGYEVSDDDLAELVAPEPEQLITPPSVVDEVEESNLTDEQISFLDPATKKSESAIRKEFEKTPEGKNILALITRFTQTRGGVANLRKQVEVYLNGGDLSPAARRRVDDFIHAMNTYPAERVPQLYRGFGVKPNPKVDINTWFDEFEARYTPGKKIDLNASSFTSSERTARGFMTTPGGGAGRSGLVQVQVVVDGPIRALPVERLSKFAYEKEWISGGEFEVTALEPPAGKRGYYILHIRQLSTLKRPA